MSDPVSSWEIKFANSVEEFTEAINTSPKNAYILSYRRGKYTDAHIPYTIADNGYEIIHEDEESVTEKSRILPLRLWDRIVK